MSPEQIPFVHAARRHLRDARSLLNASPLQAYHLAGFGPECARKALPGLADFARKLGHRIDADAQLSAFFSSLDPALHRYPVWGWARTYPALAAWSPEVRYVADTHPCRTQASQLLSDAEAAALDVVYALFADGEAPDEAFR